MWHPLHDTCPFACPRADSDLRGSLIQMAREADLIALAWRSFAGLRISSARGRFGVLTSRAMTGFACLPDAAVLLRVSTA